MSVRLLASHEPPAFLVGLDLGQAHDYTGLVVTEWTWHPPDGKRYAVRAIQRLPLGTSYPTVASHITAIVASLRTEHPSSSVDLIVDFTGVGRPVADLLLAADLDCHVTLVTITGGDQVNRGERHEYRVPKRDLASVIQVLLQSGRLKIAKELPMATTLTSELTGFRVKISLNGHDRYGAGEDWRSAPHDDLVLSLAMACWYGETRRTVQIL
jgi:Terminase RNaseH-like domain